MSHERTVESGVYDHLLSEALASDLESLGDPDLAHFGTIEKEDAHTAIAQYLEHLLVRALSQFRGDDAAQRMRTVANRLIMLLKDELGDEWVDRWSLSHPLRRLLAVHGDTSDDPPDRPDTPLRHSALLTGTRLDPSLAAQLCKEIATADRVDILCSFIKWSGLRIILDSLKALTQNAHPDGPRLRIITTSYMGATDARAIETLSELPHTEIRVSYDTTRTRLHAKAYLIHRATGFGSAYVGSANLSKAALSEGLEWTNKISQYELPHLWQKITATYDTYWNDDEFEVYDENAKERLRVALDRESSSVGFSDNPIVNFDLHPYPFQQEILDVLASEREIQTKNRHLVVAATGTGKTMIAAFDYRHWCRANPGNDSLLFVAHREEILKQALGTFRAVLRNQNFGSLRVRGAVPTQERHLFCSIQSFNSQQMWERAANEYDYVVVDEFHHAAAPSYKRLLGSVEPRVLLGLTATPERADGLDVRTWFDGEPSAQIRLPDAINRRLLCPFQYFGVADSVNLDGLQWQRGGYRTEDLEHVYTGNDARAGLVLDKVQELLLNARSARGIGFCVSIAHADFMARFFNDHGIPAASVSAKSSADERTTVRARLVSREINFIFVVDLYNEGVDIPEIDTVLFLRPTESLTVYLQQLGRGLRLHDDKDCLTVLDFIGAQRKEFRFAQRFRAMSTDPTGKLDHEVKEQFPHLPAGCTIRLERVAQERVLDNIKKSLQLRRPQIVAELRRLAGYLGRSPSISEALEFLSVSLEELLKRGLWSRLLFEATSTEPVVAPDEGRLAKGIHRLAHIDDPAQIRFLQEYLEHDRPPALTDPVDRLRLSMFLISIWATEDGTGSMSAGAARLWSNPSALRDLRSVLDYRFAHTHARTVGGDEALTGPLAIHAQYTRDEVLIGLQHWSLEKRPRFTEGVLHIAGRKIDALFATLQKTKKDQSPTTMYKNYAISDTLFHWQSQSPTSASSPTGKRYMNHRDMGYTPLLFVREHEELASGLAAPYAYLGPADFVTNQGSRPMSITWRLRSPMPSRLLRFAKQGEVG